MGTINPYFVSSYVASSLRGLILQSLFQYDERYRLVPVLASRVPTLANGDIRKGGRTVLIRLRPGQHWSNGAEVTSGDVKFGWQVDMSPTTGPACLGSCDKITSIGTPDRYTAVLHLKVVDSSIVPWDLPDVWPRAWPGYWTAGDWRAASTALLDRSFDFLGPQFPTDGPYRVVGHNATEIDFRPMRYYTGSTCGTHIGSVKFVLQAPPPSGQGPTTDYPLDYSFSWYPADIAALKSAGYAADLFPVTLLEHLELNHDPTYDGKPNPLANRLVRLALALSVDKRALIQQALGFPQSIGSRLEARTFVFNQPDSHVPYADTSITGQWDPIVRKYVEPGSFQALADARLLMARTPFAGGFDLGLYTTVGNPTRVKEVEALTHDWAQVGVRLNPEYITGQGLYDTGGKAYIGDFQVAMFAWAGIPDVASFKYMLVSSYGTRQLSSSSPLPNLNFAAINDPAIDRAFKSADKSSDPRVLARAYATVQAEVNRNADWIPLHFGAWAVVHSTRIHHFSPYLWTIPDWTLATG
jgi:ABC-type transport system substrate-binding protein